MGTTCKYSTTIIICNMYIDPRRFDFFAETASSLKSQKTCHFVAVHWGMEIGSSKRLCSRRIMKILIYYLINSQHVAWHQNSRTECSQSYTYNFHETLCTLTDNNASELMQWRGIRILWLWIICKNLSPFWNMADNINAIFCLEVECIWNPTCNNSLQKIHR